MCIAAFIIDIQTLDIMLLEWWLDVATTRQPILFQGDALYMTLSELLHV